ncbi:MAG: ABC transporter ATP-binding protein/permease [Erysipelotrichaceae bacterium]
MINKRLIVMMEDSKKHVFHTVFWQWLALVANIALILVLANFINNIRLQLVTSGEFIFVFFVAAVVFGVRFYCNRAATRASYRASVEVKSVLRDRIYGKVIELGSGYQNHIATAELVQIGVEGVEQLEIYFSKYLPQFFYSLLAPITLFAVLAWLNWKVPVALLLCVPLIPVSIIAVQKFAKKLLHKYWGLYTNLGNSFLDNLQGLVTLKVYQADENRAQFMAEEAEHFRKITMRVLTMQLNSISVMDIIAYGGTVLGVVLAIGEFQAGALGFAGVIAMVLLSSEFFIPLRLLGSFFHIAMNGMAACKKIFAFLDAEVVDESQHHVVCGVEPITLEDVCFAYEADRMILNQVSMRFEPGKLTSIVGESGCGKSTIASLLFKEYHVEQGELRYGTHRYQDIQSASLLRQMTRVTHLGYVFKGTVADNLRMAKPDATQEEMVAVLQQVELYDFVMAQAGLNTSVDAHGTNFSGGQRQRLVLARALLYNTDFYVFDEATSNIDVESETKIMEIIKSLAKTKTVVLISHRLENVKDSDQIYVMDQGSVVEYGQHETLLANKGCYHKLVTTQQALEQVGGV